MARSPNPTISRPQVEADRIHRAVFGGTAPKVLARRFAQASERLDAAAAPAELALYRRALERIGDLEALETACRLTGRLPLLSRKFLILVYLAETLPTYQQYFVNERDSLARGLWALAAGGAVTAWKAAKGLWLWRRLGHA